MKLRLGRKKFSIEEIEREASAEIERQVSKGKPPPEEWKGLAGRVDPDVILAGRPRSFTPPPPPPPARPSRPTAAEPPADTEEPAAAVEPAVGKATARKAPAAKAPAAEATTRKAPAPKAVTAKATAKKAPSPGKGPAAKRKA